MGVKRSDIMALARVLQSVVEVRGKLRFIYWVNKNLKSIQGEMEYIETALKPVGRLAEFEQKQRDLILSLAAKDPAGNPVVAQGGMVNVAPENMDEFREKHTELSKEYADVINDRERAETVREFLEDKVAFNPWSISMTDLPDDVFSAMQVGLLIDAGMIRDGDEV